jgi:hypothetical protein
MVITIKIKKRWRNRQRIFTQESFQTLKHTPLLLSSKFLAVMPLSISVGLASP